MKKILIILCALVVMAFGGNVAPITTAKADTEDYVADSYQIEISNSEVMLPVPNMPASWAYSITLKDGANVLGEKITKYVFEKTGEYTLVYTIHREGLLTDILEETAKLTVADMTKPTLTTDGYDSEYYVGDTLLIQTAQVHDNVDDGLMASVALYLGEEQLVVENGKITFKKTGDYVLTYKATDKSGNEGTLTYEFTVIARDTDANDDKNNGGCGSAIFGGTTVAICAGICVALLIKRNKNK